MLQARDERGKVIFTLVDVSTHAETLAFSGVTRIHTMISADWPGQMRKALEARWPGSVGIELAGLVGSVETPTVYEPESTQVLRVPEALHDVSGNPDGCRSVYPQPVVGNARIERARIPGGVWRQRRQHRRGALEGARTFTPHALHVQQTPLCMELENNLFKAAFAAGLFPDRPLYANSTCTEPEGGRLLRAPLEAGPADSNAHDGKTVGRQRPLPEVGGRRADAGARSSSPTRPGEVFPFTEVRGAIDEEQMAFPTNCYEP